MTVVIGVETVAVMPVGVATVTVAAGVLTVTVAGTAAATDETGVVGRETAGSRNSAVDAAGGSAVDEGAPAAEDCAAAGDDPVAAGEPCGDARLALTRESRVAPARRRAEPSTAVVRTECTASAVRLPTRVAG